MCGRATVVNPDGIDQTFYGFSKKLVPSDLKPRYNLNPREEIPVVHVDPASGERVLRMMHWNLIPGHFQTREQLDAFDAQYSTFNAKIERVATAPSFRGPWRRQRCLVVVDGIIEWAGAKGAKIPHWIRHRTHGSFAMAGLWSVWRGKNEGEEFWSCTVVIGPCDDWYSRFHSRMAYLLRPEVYDRWLDPGIVEADRARGLLEEAPYPLDSEMEAVAVSKRVNNPRYDAPDCLEPAGAPPANNGAISASS